MFLTCLFNGSSGFDLMNSLSTSNTVKEPFSLDTEKLQQHIVLCKHLEDFVASHKESGNIVVSILASTVPIFVKLINFSLLSHSYS